MRGIIRLLTCCFVLIFGCFADAWSAASCAKTYTSCNSTYYLDGSTCSTCPSGCTCAGGTAAPVCCSTSKACPSGYTAGGSTYNECTTTAELACYKSCSSYTSGGYTYTPTNSNAYYPNDCSYNSSCTTPCTSVANTTQTQSGNEGCSVTGGTGTRSYTNKCNGYYTSSGCSSAGASCSGCSSWSRTSTGSCSVTSCNAGYEKSGNSCYACSNYNYTDTENITNGKRSRSVTYSSTAGGSCTASYGSWSYSCNTGYSVSGSSCVANTITINLNKNGGSGTCGGKTGTTAGTMSCTYNGTCTLPDWNSSTCNITKSGKILVGWNTNSGGTGTNYSLGEDITNIVSSGSKTLYAKWADVSCSATNGSVTSSSVSNNAPSCAVTCNSGYSSSGTYTGTSGNASYSYTCTGNTITITYNNGGHGTAPSGTTCTYGGTFKTASALSATGYNFGGWSVNGATKSAAATINCDYSTLGVYSDSVTLTGVWSGKTYTVTLNKNNGTGGTGSVTATYGSPMPTITSLPTRTSYSFSGYSTNNTCTETLYYNADGTSARNWDKTAATTLYACWTLNEVTCPQGQYLDGTDCKTCDAGYACPGGTFTYNGQVQGRTICANWTYSGSGAKSCTSCPNLTSGYSKKDSTGTGWTSYTNCQEAKSAASVSSSYCYGGELTKTATSASAWGTATSTLTAKKGSHISGSGDSTTCTQCTDSTYQSTDGSSATSCTSCPGQTSGWTRTTGTGWTSYTSCQETKTISSCYSGYQTLTKTATSSSGWGTATGDLRAPKGSYVSGSGDNKTCTQCSGSTYQSADGSSATSCTNCPSNDTGWTLGTGTGWTNYSSCYETQTPSGCASGTVKRAASSASAYSSTITLEDTLKSSGGYYATSTATSCTKATAGYYAAAGATGQTECGDAKWSNDGAASCTDCPNPDSGWTAHTTTTTANSYSACYETQTPSGCASGTVKRAASSASAYSSTITLEDTLKSSGGYYATSTATSCTKATAGYYAAAGATGQTECGDAKWSNDGAASCTDCPNPDSGWTKHTTTTTANSYDKCYESKTGTEISTYCSAGELRRTASSTTKYSSTTNTQTPLSAKSGSIVSGLTCTQCEAGYYSAGGTATSCSNCASSNGANGRPQYSDAGASSCTECPAVSGTYASRATGSYAYYPSVHNNGANGCFAYFTDSDSNATFDTLCYYNSADGGYGGANSLCQFYEPSSCAAGYYSTISSTSQWVSAGNYAGCYGVDCMKDKVCTDVGDGYFSPLNDTTRTACSSLGSFYTKSDNGRGANTTCYGTTVAGRAINTVNASDQTTCAKGSRCVGNAKVYYGSIGGSELCPCGSYQSDAGQSYCIDTDGGYYANGTGNINQTPVGAGNWAQAKACSPTACSGGLTTIGYGMGADSADDCGRKLHIGNEVMYLRSARKTNPSLNIDIDRDGRPDFYANVSTGDHLMSIASEKAFKYKNNGTTYFIYDDSYDFECGVGKRGPNCECMRLCTSVNNSSGTQTCRQSNTVPNAATTVCPDGNKYCIGNYENNACYSANETCSGCSAWGECNAQDCYATKCNTNYYLSGGACNACGANSSANGSATTCTCTTGYSSDGTVTGSATSTTGCSVMTLTCPAGQYVNWTSKKCESCPAGSYCPGGEQKYTDTLKKYTCNSGFTTDGGASASTQCYRACKTSDVANSSVVSGTYYQGGSNTCAATSCNANHYLSGGACNACGANSSANGSAATCTCTAGYTVNGTAAGANTSTSGCSPVSVNCSAGTFMWWWAGDGRTNCESCHAGYYCPGGTNVYDSGSVGASNSAGVTPIYACNSGFTTNGGASASTQCYRTCTTSDVSHSTAVSGTYYQGGSNTCVPTACATNYYLSNNTCNLCSASDFTYTEPAQNIANGTKAIKHTCTAVSTGNGTTCSCSNETTSTTITCNTGYKQSGDECKLDPSKAVTVSTSDSTWSLVLQSGTMPDNTPITGGYLCSTTTSSSTGGTKTGLSSSDTTTASCYCSISGVSGTWIYSGKKGTNGLFGWGKQACTSYCLGWCKDVLEDNSTARTNVYNLLGV